VTTNPHSHEEAESVTSQMAAKYISASWEKKETNDEVTRRLGQLKLRVNE